MNDSLRSRVFSNESFYLTDTNVHVIAALIYESFIYEVVVQFIKKHSCTNQTEQSSPQMLLHRRRLE